MKKPMLIGLIAAIAALGLLFAAIRSAQDAQKNTPPELSALLNLPITIDGENFTLSNGAAEKSNGAAEKVSAPGSAAQNTVALVGEPVTGDVTGDGKPDAALLIRNDPGGSGTFYYAVVAVGEGGSYRATNALPLGDRITPQAVDFAGGRFIYRFVERGAEESMAQTPTLERSVSVVFDPKSRSISAVGYFPGADWLWQPIGMDPALATDSATWVDYLSQAGSEHVAELYREGTTLIPSTAVTGSTPRYDITFTQPWGSDPFGDYRVPIPLGTHVPQYEGGDGHLAIQDPATGQVFGLWQANYDSATNNWTASWGGMTPIDGDGVDTSGSATATNLSRYAGVVTAAEMTAAITANSGLNHALVFATDIAGPDFLGPATKSDGANIAGVANPISEGYRVQLDPTIDIDAIPGITAGEKVIAKTLQSHGAYVIDNGSARMAFAFEAVPGSSDSDPGRAWTDAGFEWDYYDMDRIPWAQLRVVAG